MNSKKSKDLRKAASLITMGSPTTKYIHGTPPQFMPFKGRLVKFKNGIPCTLDPNCTRAIYKRLKKGIG